MRQKKLNKKNVMPETVPEPVSGSKPLSKRQLMERGEYMLVNFQLPVSLYNELKQHQLMLELKGEKLDRADIVKLALKSYLEQQK